MDPLQVYPIPNTSNLQPINHLRFRVDQLQPGILNDSNCCCLLSLLLCLHRLSLVNFFIDPSQMMRNGAPDFTIMTLMKILKALPSTQAFSINSFITSWNRDGRGIQLGQNEDLYIVEGILKQLSLRHRGPGPVLTLFKASYFCPQCQVQYRGITEWLNQRFELIPELRLPDQQQQVNPADLITELMNERFQVICQVCQHQINDASFDIQKGKFTILTLNRAVIRNRRMAKIMTPISSGVSNCRGSQFIGELVAVVCHRTQPHLHWVSYTKADNRWFRNDDHNPPVPAAPFNSGNPDETINMLCYINN